MSLTVFLGHDHDIESPADYDGWTPYSFSTKHANFKHPDELNPDEDEELKAKLTNGLAFFLSYYEHGRCLWSLSGEGPRCRWDSVSQAGLVIWEGEEGDIGAKTYEDREKDARAFLDSWNAYCNGDAYYFSIVSDCETCGSSDKSQVLESCGGFLGDSSVAYMFEQIKEHVGDKPVKFKGEAKYLADYHWE